MATQWTIFKQYAFFMSENCPKCLPTLYLLLPAAAVLWTNTNVARYLLPHRCRSMFTFYQHILSLAVWTPNSHAHWLHMVHHLGCLYKLHRAEHIYHFRLPCLFTAFFFSSRWTSHCFFRSFFFFRFFVFNFIISRFAYYVFHARWKTKRYQFSHKCIHQIHVCEIKPE